MSFYVRGFEKYEEIIRKQANQQEKDMEKVKYLYPSVISRNCNIDIEQVSKMLDFLTRMKVLDKNYEVCCHICQRHQGDILEDIEESKKQICACCGKYIEKSDLQIVYKVR